MLVYILHIQVTIYVDKLYKFLLLTICSIENYKCVACYKLVNIYINPINSCTAL